MSYQKMIDNEGRLRPAHADSVRVIRASELLAQRMTGRHVGSDVSIDYDPAKTYNDYETDVAARFIEKHGARWGVNIRRTGG